MLGAAIAEPNLPLGISDAVWGLAKFHDLTEKGSVTSLRPALERLRAAGGQAGSSHLPLEPGRRVFRTLKLRRGA
jgi:hypothetical protein